MSNLGMVSVVIPCFNASDYIVSTINSIQDQTYKNLEIIVVDDCSTDNSYEIIKKIKANSKNIKILKTESNTGGPATPRNIGIKNSTGEYIAFCDADDIWHPQKLEVQVKFLEKYDFVCSKIDVFKNEIDIKFEAFIRFNFEFSEIKHDRLIKKNFIANSSVILNRKILNDLWFSNDQKLIAVEDYELWLRLHHRMNLKSIKIHKSLLFYRIVDNSISRSKFKMFHKINYLLKNYKINNKKLGLVRYYYLLTYILGALTKKIR